MKADTNAKKLAQNAEYKEALLSASSVPEAFPGYLETCARAASDTEFFADFRRSQIIVRIIEGNKDDRWQDPEGFIDYVVRNNPELIPYFPAFRTSDDLGGPILCTLEPHGKFSCATTRYVYHLAMMKNLFATLDGMRIVEIGPGYGGECKIIHDVFRPASYTLVDLPAPLMLAMTFLENFGLDEIQYLTMEELADTAEYDLVISQYAFTECRKEVEQIYLDKILKNARCGYLLCNWMTADVGFQQLSKEELLSSIPGSRDLPHFPAQEGSFTMAWGHG